MTDQFNQVEDQYFRLKGQLTSGRITREQLESALKDMMIQDAQGRYWMLGVDDAKWYVNDGSNWIETAPAGAAAPTVSSVAMSAAPLGAKAQTRGGNNTLFFVISGIALLFLISSIGFLLTSSQGTINISLGPTATATTNFQSTRAAQEQATRAAQEQTTAAARSNASVQAQSTTTARSSVTRQSNEASAAAANALMKEAMLWDVIISEKFDESSDSCKQDAIEEKHQVRDGKCRWEIKTHRDDQMSSDFLFDMGTDGVAYMSVEGRVVNAPRNAHYGLFFEDTLLGQDQYVFAVTPGEGSYYVSHYNYKQGWANIIPPTNNPTIQRDAPNRLTLIAKAGRVTFFINDKYVGEFNNIPMIAKSISGIFAELTTSGDFGIFEFDNFEVRAP